MAGFNVTTQTPWLKHLPSWIYKLAAQAWFDPTYPRHLFIETTAACNLACAYCPRERRGDTMEWTCFTGLIDEATRYGPRSFSLHLFGEPLLYPRLCEAIAYIKAKTPRHTVLLTTNGTRLNTAVDDLIRLGVDQIFWTWRPEATFTAATKTKLRRWGRFRVRFLHEVTPSDAYDEWKNWPNIEGRRLHNYGGGIDVTKFGGNTNLPKTRYPCYHLFLAPAVAWNGDILMCCALPHHEEVLGHFPEMSLHDAWTGTQLKVIRQAHLAGQFTGPCTTCDVWKQYPSMHFRWQGTWAKLPSS